MHRPCPGPLSKQEVVLLKFGDHSNIKRAQAALAAGTENAFKHSAQADVVVQEASELFMQWSALPGISRRGLPKAAPASERGTEQTALIASAPLPPTRLERVLRCAHFADMLSAPSPSFIVSELANGHLAAPGDTKQQRSVQFGALTSALWSGRSRAGQPSLSEMQHSRTVDKAVREHTVEKVLTLLS